LIWEGTDDLTQELTAKNFVERLDALLSPEDLKQFRQRLKSAKTPDPTGDISMGVRMGMVFALAKEFMEMPPEEIEKLLESPVHDVRAGAVSIMDWQARNKKTSAGRRQELFDLYIRRHDRINDWDLVDRSAPYVVGGYLFDRPRDVLYLLAHSRNWWERRTAIVSTYYFIRQGDLDDTFKIAGILVQDEEDLVQKAVGGWVREAGKKDQKTLLAFLDQYAATMPRTTLRYAIEHLNQQQKDYYMNLKKKR
jgi:3-methyladenine DNA glycosylase AlkD